MMNLDEFADILPEELQGYYMNSALQMVPITFTRAGSGNTSGVSAYCGGDRGFLEYECSLSGQGFEYPYAPVFQLEVPFTLTNVTYISFRAGAWVNLDRYMNANASSISSVSNFHYTLNGSDNTQTLLRSQSDSSKPAWFRQTGGYSRGYSCILMEFSGDPVTFRSLEVSGCYMYQENNKYAFSLYTPIISDDYQIDGFEPEFDGGDSVGVVTGEISDNGDGSQSINITVETDNSGLISGILSGLKNLFAFLFIPDQDFMNSWHEDIEDSFADHLGGVAQAVSLIDEQADYLRAATSADYIYFPELTLPIGDSGGSASHPLIGSDYTLIEGRQVELRPARTGKLKILWDFVEFAVDVVCVLAVFNMLQTKYEIFLNPDGEVISYDN